MNPATIVITMPRKKSDPTEYTYIWATKAVQMAKSLGYNVIAIKEDDANYKNVSKILKENKVRLYIHFGHGCQLSLQGQNECIISRKYTADQLICMAESPYIEEKEKVLKLLNPLGELSCPGICRLDVDPCSPLCTYDTNVNLLKGTISVAIACHSAAMLGRCAIAYGTTAYVGYKELLMFPVDSKGSQNMFGNMQLVMVKELLLGNSVAGANEAMKKAEDDFIRKYKKVKYMALPMLWDQMHREVLGNPNTRIYE